MKRLFDLTASSVGLIIFLAPMILIGVVIKLTSTGPCIHWSNRIGQNNKHFMMPKFRTMKMATPDVASDKLENPSVFITPVGGVLRVTSLDELPQLWSVFRGQMSLVGPRPALFNQYDLIALRTEVGIHELLPGITGLAQINGRDELDLREKVALDLKYKQNRTFCYDLEIIFFTIFKTLSRRSVSH